MERPYTSLETFGQNKELGLKAVKSLKKHYDRYAKKQNGFISNFDMDNKIFPKVIKELQPLSSYQENIIESLFDSFLGMLMMIGNSEQAFKLLEKQAKGEY